MSELIDQIVSQIGGTRLSGGAEALCPGPNHAPHDRSMKVSIGDRGQVLVHSFSPNTSWQECRDWLASKNLIDTSSNATSGDFKPREGTRIQTPSPQLVRKKAISLVHWLRAQRVTGTLGERYLLQRGLRLSDATSPALRFAPQMMLQPYGPKPDRPLKSQRIPTAPALLAAICDADSELSGLSITYLNPVTGDRRRSRGGRGIERLIIGSYMGNSVPLNPADSEMLVGEGIETTASASCRFSLPGHALLGANNFYRWTPPTFVKRLVIAGDNGQAGTLASDYLKQKCLALGIDVRIETPKDNPDWDWNDYDRARFQSEASFSEMAS